VSQKYYLTKLISETKDLTLDYNPILEQALRVHLITKSPKIYVAFAFL
jgi:hypothetical protein